MEDVLLLEDPVTEMVITPSLVPDADTPALPEVVVVTLTGIVSDKVQDAGTKVQIPAPELLLLDEVD